MCSEAAHLFHKLLTIPCQFLLWDGGTFYFHACRETFRVWLLTAGSGPRISGTQLPYRHLLALTHTYIYIQLHTHTHIRNRQTGTGKQSIWTPPLGAVADDCISVVVQGRTMCICKKKRFSKEQKSVDVSNHPMCFRFHSILYFKGEVLWDNKWWKNVQFRREIWLFRNTTHTKLGSSCVPVYSCWGSFDVRSNICLNWWN